MSTASEVAMGGEGSIRPAGPSGWRNIGRALRLAVIGDAALAEAVRRYEAGRVTVFDGGTWGALEDGLDRLAPASTDAVVIAHDGPRGEAEELARIVRGRLLGVVLVLPEALAPLLRTHLGVVRSEGADVLGPLMDVVSVAAQTTWALEEVRRAAAAHGTVEDPGDDDPTDEIDRAAVKTALEAADETRMLRPPSTTVQMEPSAELLAALVVEEPLEAPAGPATLTEGALFSRSIAVQMDAIRAEVVAEVSGGIAIEDPANETFELHVPTGAVMPVPPEVVAPSEEAALGRIALERSGRTRRVPPPPPPADSADRIEVVTLPPAPHSRSLPSRAWLLITIAVVLLGLALGVWTS